MKKTPASRGAHDLLDVASVLKAAKKDSVRSFAGCHGG
jgi:hypothetical protein